MKDVFVKKERCSFKLPIDICDFAISNKYFSPLRLYLYLKWVSDGQLKLPPEIRKHIAQKLNCNERTVRNNLKILKERNWIGYNSQSKYYMIRGFKKVHEI